MGRLCLLYQILANCVLVMRKYSLRHLVWWIAYPILSRVKQLDNAHLGADCYIFGDGPSIAHFDLAAFSDKIGIAVNAFPRHKDAAKANLKYWVVAESAFFLPPVFSKKKNRAKSLRRRLQFQRFYSPPIDGLENLIHFVSLTSFPFRFRKNTQYFFDRFPRTYRKLTYRPGNENFEGSINAAISLAIYLGFSRAYLVGFDYTHNPPVGGKWYGINKTSVAKPNLQGYNWSFFDQISRSIELVTVTLTDQSTYLKSITYSALTGKSLARKRNNEILKPEDLDTLSTHYPVFESQRYGKRYRHFTRRSLLFSLMQTIRQERQFKKVNVFFRHNSSRQNSPNLLVTKCQRLSDAWQLEQIPHDEATLGIQTALRELDLTKTCFLELSKLHEGLLRQGLFSAALHVLRRQCDLVLLQERVGSPTHLRSILVSVYQGNLQLASEKLAEIPEFFFGEPRSSYNTKAEISLFIQACSSDGEVVPCIRPRGLDREFWSFARGRECVLTGPGVSGSKIINTSTDAAWSRIMKNGIGIRAERELNSDILCNTVYLNSATAQWMVRNKLTRMLEDCNFAVFKDEAEYLIGRHAIRNGRKVPFSPGLSALFWSGTAGMGLISIFDSMIAPYSQVSLSGFDLYTTEHEYHPSLQKELIAANKTAAGPAGTPFYRCHVLAEHNPFLSRWLLGAFGGSRRFHPDARLDRVLKMTDDEYANTLDLLHGTRRK